LIGQVTRDLELVGAVGGGKRRRNKVAAAGGVSVAGVISDGQHSVRNAVAAALPGVPHQLCQFHYLREAARPIFEMDRHAKKELKKHVRDIRPIERAVEARAAAGDDDDAAGPGRRGLLLGRAPAITDDGRPPLDASGLPCTGGSPRSPPASRPSRKKGLPAELQKLKGIVDRGLERTAELWPDVRVGFDLVHRAAHALGGGGDDDGRPGSGTAVVRRRRHRRVLDAVRAAARRATPGGELHEGLEHFRTVSASYAPGLFHCYDVPGLPRTNNDLEQLFGSTRHHERRCTGRKVASPSLVLRGSVRVVAGLGTRACPTRARKLAPDDPDAWRAVRAGLEQRRRTRVLRCRFRRDPATYLQQLEVILLKPALPV